MLEELHVKDMALIEEAWLEFAPGMTVLTGETGAGKTALLGALKLLLGERADSSSVRSGATETLVEGRFAGSEGEVIARRRVTADGRSRCTLDGEMATVGALAQRVGPLVDLHGQHEHQALLSASTHVGYLDRWAGEPALVALKAYENARSSYRDALAALSSLEDRISEATRNADYLRFIAEEIDRVAPVEGEDEALEARLPALQHAERLAEAANTAAVALRAESGALDRIAEAAAALAKVDGIDPSLDDVAARLTEAQVLVDEAGTAVRAYRDSVEHDPSVLEQVLSRLSALEGLKKKYGPSLAAVLAAREEASTAFGAAEDSELARREATAAVESAESCLRDAAAALAEIRHAAAPGFTESLGAIAEDLAMTGARFEVGFEELAFENWMADGSERIEFLYSPAASQPPRSLARIASGGEISRVMLALKGVLGSADSVETLVFDEVDSGIGGATAHAVGARLAQLARSHQLIVVTHLAQVAAHASRHLVVRKRTDGDGVSTEVACVEGEARVGEIARMLSGNDSEVSLAHATELLDQAEAARF